MNTQFTNSAFLPPPHILTCGRVVLSSVLFIVCLLLFFFGNVCVVNADEWDSLNTFFFDNYHVYTNVIGNNVSAGTLVTVGGVQKINDQPDRFGNGLLGGLGYVTNNSQNWQTQVGNPNNVLLMAGKGNDSSSRARIDYNFATNMGTSTVAEEGGRLYELNFRVNPCGNYGASFAHWAGIIFGSNEDLKNINQITSGFSILFRRNGGIQAFDGTSGTTKTINLTETFTVPQDNWSDIKIQFSVPDFNTDKRVNINLYINNELIHTFQTDKGFTKNYIQFRSYEPENSNGLSKFTNVTLKSSANYNYDVSNADVFALDKNWTTNGLDKRDVIFLSDRDGETEADHTGTIVLGADTKFDISSDLTLTQSGAISGTGNIVKNGNGALILSQANSYNGDTTISAGTLKLSGAGTLGTGAVSVGENATLEIAYDNPSTSVNISSISMSNDSEFNEGSSFKVTSGTVTFGTTDVALNNLSGGSLKADGTIDVASTITVTGNLTLNNDQLTKFIGSIKAPLVTKTGLDTLQLCFDAVNAVNIGSLVVSSGRLDLKGYMSGGISVEGPNAVFSPGNSVGDAVFGGGYILKDGATLLIEQDETGIDTLTAQSFGLDGNDNHIEFDFTAFAPGKEYDYIILTDGFGEGQNEPNYWTALYTGNLPDYFTTSVFINDDGYGVVRLTSPSANEIPEPSTWALLLLGAAGLLYVRKRTRK